jgi:hypothetical protein
MKTLNQMYRILKANLPSVNINFYICNEIQNLKKFNLITDKEYLKLINHFKKERPTPTKHVRFYKHKNYSKNGMEAWWLYDGEQRHLFIDKMIRITK